MRITNIINDLYTSNKYLSITYFMDKYSVSKRTLQNDLSYLSNVSKEKGFKLIQKRGAGYLLEVQNSILFNDFLNQLNKMYNSLELNIENIIAYIAIKDNYITVDELVEKFKSSRSVINGYREEIDEYLLKYNLTIERKTHYGMKILNKLKDRRNLILNLYIQENYIIKEYIDNILKNDFEDIEKELKNSLKSNHLLINYVELKEIIYWLKVTICLNEKIYEQSKDNIKINSQLIKLNSRFNLFSSDKEELENLIKSKTRKKFEQNKSIETLSINLDKFLSNFDKLNNTLFSKDEKFKKALLNHLAHLIERSSFSVSYKNPIIDEIQIKYPIAFNIAILLGKMLKKEYGVDINCDEIGFIATYFAMNIEEQLAYKFKKYNSIAIVCSSGGGSSQLIKLKIKSIFKDADIKTFSILQINELEDFNPNIIFSICELKTKLEVPVIYIKELLDDYDVLKIKELVIFENFSKSFIEIDKESFISKLFNIDYFELGNKPENYMKCLEEMSNKIELNKIGGDNYSSCVINREKFSSTIYLNGVAIPHPIEMNGNKNLVSVKVLKEPIEFEGKKVSLIFMICLKKENLELHKKITNDLYKIMNDSETVQLLTQVKSFKEFVALINQRI